MTHSVSTACVLPMPHWTHHQCLHMIKASQALPFQRLNVHFENNHMHKTKWRGDEASLHIVQYQDVDCVVKEIGRPSLINIKDNVRRVDQVQCVVAHACVILWHTFTALVPNFAALGELNSVSQYLI